MIAPPKTFGTWAQPALRDQSTRDGMMPINLIPLPGERTPEVQRELPIPAGVPFGPFKTFEARLTKNHGNQSAQLIQGRGGLAPLEMLAILEDKPWAEVSERKDEREGLRRVLAWFKGWGWTPWTLDDALAGNVYAIGEDLEQMAGALHKVDTLHAPGFVKTVTLNRLADEVLRLVTSNGAALHQSGANAPRRRIGQELDVVIYRAEKPDRVTVALVRGEYLYMAPPGRALRKWAKWFLGLEVSR